MMATELGLVTPLPTTYTTLAVCAIRTLIATVTTQNPLTWPYLGGKNERADVEGPFYLYGAPKVEYAEGKAIMAPLSLLRKHRPFLMTVRVLTPDGQPLRGATLDWWQADSDGSYYFTSYTLRGRVRTDADGKAEVLTVPPGVYGALGGVRAGHFHAKVIPPAGAKTKDGKELEELTTQIYVCKENSVEILKGDFVNYMRKTRLDNMVQAWSSPSKDVDDGRGFMGFPVLAASEVEAQGRVRWFKEQFDGNGLQDLNVAAGAFTEFRLSPKSWL